MKKGKNEIRNTVVLNPGKSPMIIPDKKPKIVANKKSIL